MSDEVKIKVISGPICVVIEGVEYEPDAVLMDAHKAYRDQLKALEEKRQRLHEQFKEGVKNIGTVRGAKA